MGSEGYQLRPGWAAVDPSETLSGDEVYYDATRFQGKSWHVTLSKGIRAGECGNQYFRRTGPEAALPPLEPVPKNGPPIRHGWRRVMPGEKIQDGDVAMEPFTGTWKETKRAGRFARECDIRYFRKTLPDANLPPVVDEPADDVRRALEIVGDTITDLRREREELLKQADVLTKERDAIEGERERLAAESRTYRASSEMATQTVAGLRKQVETLIAERDGLQKQVAELREAAVKAATTWPDTPDWRSKLRPCWVRYDAKSLWRPAWFHRWKDGTDEQAIVERGDGFIEFHTNICFIDPTKEQVS